MPDRAVVSADPDISFGPFHLLPARQLLLEGAKPVRLGSRALGILIALVGRAGEFVSKDELIARVWPDTFVEEGNLRVHVAALRRALGDGQAGNRYIVNVPGRGYSFVAPVSRSEGTLAARPIAVEPTHNLPAPLARMVGRDDTVHALAAKLPLQRFITIVGPGGIGKTTVALAVAGALIASYKNAVRFVDLSPLADPLLVPSALASELGLAILSGDPIPGLIAFLRDRQMLLVLDGCEHVIVAAAALAEEVIRNAPGVHILATSREPLRAEGEHVHRLPPLAAPVASASPTASEALSFPAVQLFVERAVAGLDGFELSDADAPIVADICRRLDGIALAIELAAGRVDAFGIRELAARLDDRFRLLTRGRRTALPRHQTLRAMLDWSYEFLPESERVILRRLAVFAVGFSMESASAVAADSKIAAPDVVETVADLVARSLVTADAAGRFVRYRLPDTTRAYALEKLTKSGELDRFARRHAEYYRDRLKRAEAETATRPTAEWLATYGRAIDNVRAALDWAFSPGGDTDVGAALAVAAVPLWVHLSLLEECRRRVMQALESGGAHDARREMQLFAALGQALLYTRIGPEARAASEKALRIAENLGDIDYQLRALWGLWISRLESGGFREALAIAQQFHGIAASSADPNDPLIGERLIGLALRFLGDLTGAQRHIKRMLDRYVAPAHGSYIIRFGFDQQVAAGTALAPLLWLRGFPDQAMRAVETNIDHARAIGHALSLCNALAQSACPVAFLTGDLAAAERFVTMLLDTAAMHGLSNWHGLGRCFEGMLVVKRGDVAGGLSLLRVGLDALRAFRTSGFHKVVLCDLADALGRAGATAEGLAVVDEALARSERTEERWCSAELLRTNGNLILQHAAPNAAAAAEEHFERSLDWARRQEALSWELRTATSFARLRRDQGRPSEGRDLLASVYGRFSEGFATADLKAAKGLLDALA